MRWLLGIAIVVLAAAAAAGVYAYAHAGPPVVLPPPVHLQVVASGSPLLKGEWTNQRHLDLSARSRKGVVAGADVEVRPRGARLDGQANAASAAPSATDPSVRVTLRPGHYHWQIRLHNQSGVSPWRRYDGTINIDTQPPSAPVISSPSDPDPHTVYHRNTLTFTWHASDRASGIAGYSYSLDTEPSGTAAPHLRTQNGSISLKILNSGTYYFHLRAADRAGNWSPGSTFPVRVDVTPPGLAHVDFSRFQLNPQYNNLQVSFQVTRASKFLHVGIYHHGALVRLYSLNSLDPGKTASVAWNGRDTRGALVPPGSYDVFIRATDKYGHTSLHGWHDILVDYQRIVISLGKQKLWAYNGSHVFLTSLVTTGNRALPTPVGIYSVMAKFHPYTFISPWPKTSRFYYEPSKVQYALLFRTGGYFIHDAPWRSVFGPGSNAELGTPGTNYTGSHGCVNTPANVAIALYKWAPIGTVVVVEK
ncbi:MAG: L,D-transpeptidase family protein [Chloroflexota bacterium]